VRGWLCRSCNGREGHARWDDAQFAKYRNRNLASILGLEIRYWSPFMGWAEPEPPLTPDEQLARDAEIAGWLEKAFGGQRHDN
jgi:hypothetical protein